MLSKARYGSKYALSLPVRYGPLGNRCAISLEYANAGVAGVSDIHAAIWSDDDADRLDELGRAVADTAPGPQECTVWREDLHALVTGIDNEDLVAGYRHRARTEEESGAWNGVGGVGRITVRAELPHCIAIAIQHHYSMVPGIGNVDQAIEPNRNSSGSTSFFARAE